MSYFKAKMHQIRFPPGLRPRPCWGSLQRSPRPLYLRGVLVRGGRGKGRGDGKRRGREREGRRGDGTGG